ncbi:hypothetical protein [uncultured Selenomonas sp.]|uniref:hypothetical protein n=1 Tax=uncultured Selenomonas sp. TaxID=159275 RepID=UPI0028D1C19E|nr:hypothetical protein [uncultured Selenomonas sp.]
MAKMASVTAQITKDGRKIRCQTDGTGRLPNSALPHAIVGKNGGKFGIFLHFHIFIVSSQKALNKQPPSLSKRWGLLAADCHFAYFCSWIACAQLLFVYHTLLFFSYQTLPTMNHRRFFALASSLALLARPMRRAKSRRRK